MGFTVLVLPSSTLHMNETHLWSIPWKAVVLAIFIHWNGKHVWHACRTDKKLLPAYLDYRKSNSLPLQKAFSEAVFCDLPSLFQNSKTCQHISQYLIKTWYSCLNLYIYLFTFINFRRQSARLGHDKDLIHGSELNTCVLSDWVVNCSNTSVNVVYEFRTILYWRVVFTQRLWILDDVLAMCWV